MTISEVTKNTRATYKLTQAAMADTLGVSHQAVSKWENGLARPDVTLLMSAITKLTGWPRVWALACLDAHQYFTLIVPEPENNAELGSNQG